MALFRRNKQQQTQIPELQDYYATQKKEGSGKAWLLAVGSLLITIAIFIGLFMGGRWLYRAVTNNDEPVQTTQTESNKSDQSSSTNNTSTAPSTDSNSNSGSTSTGSSTSGSTTTTGGAQGVSPSQTTQSNQSASAATTSIPNTGSGSVAVIFAITTIAGAVLHRRITLSKN